jgi:hypothetical protein
MEYLAQMAGGVKFWHPLASRNEVEASFGIRSSHHHSVGEIRDRGSNAIFRETYCQFEIVPLKQSDAGEVIRACLQEIELRRQPITQLIETGGEMSVIVKVFTDLVQINLEPSVLSALVQMKTGLTFEFYDAGVM